MLLVLSRNAKDATSVMGEAELIKTNKQGETRSMNVSTCIQNSKFCHCGRGLFSSKYFLANAAVDSWLQRRNHQKNLSDTGCALSEQCVSHDDQSYMKFIHS
jgi:hypothetical protein